MFKFFRYTFLTVVLCCFLFPGAGATKVWGQTIHVVLAADRADINLASALKIDLENMIHLFRSNVPAAHLNLIALEIEAMTPDGILKSIDDLNVDINDTVVFYYSGHGAYDTNGQKQFLALTKGGRLYRETVLAKIEGKFPRLAVLLTDCCNNEVNVAGTRSVGTDSRIVKMPNDFSPLFANLFVYCKGVADITSSKQGEYSFIDNVNKSRGSCFTWALVELLNNNKTDEDMYWKEVNEKLGPEVQKAFREAHPQGVDIRGVKQTTQTVYKYSLPGDHQGDTAPIHYPQPAPQSGPRLGLRAINHDGNGVRITEIVSNAPAGKVGFIVGEVVIEINGTVIRNETDYSNAVDNSPQTMQMKLKKADGSTRTVNVELGW